MIKNRDTFDVTKYRALIIKCANKFNQSDDMRKELIQVGYIAVFEASQSFNESKGKFFPFIKVAINNAMINYLIKFGNTVRVPATKIRAKDETIKRSISLNTPTDENGGILEDFIASDEETPYNDFTLLKTALDSLKKDDHKDMIKMKYGMQPYQEEYTLEEIAHKYDCSKENVRQIIKKVLYKLQNDSRVQKNREDFKGS